MKKCYVFCHGFGFDKNFWKNLSPYFFEKKCIYLDLGYFEEKVEPCLNGTDTKFIGIGHSLGLLKLLQLNINFEYLIGINSFVNFLGNDQELQTIRKNDLQVLKDNFIVSPDTTLKNFHRRCGMPYEIKNINKQIALNDLNLLFTKFDVSHKTPLLVIGSSDDVIVPKKIIYDNFESYSNVSLQIIDGGKHGLGFFKADSIYEKIMSFVNDTN